MGDQTTLGQDPNWRYSAFITNTSAGQVQYLDARHRTQLNLVEVWLPSIERQASHPGTFNSVKDLNAKLLAFINGSNDRCHPFTWTKPADEILRTAHRQATSDAGN